MADRVINWSTHRDSFTIFNQDNPKEKIRVPIPRVLMDGKMVSADKAMKAYGMDAWPTPSVGVTQSAFAQMNRILVDNTFLGYGEYSIIAQNGLISRMCTLLADNMTNKWIELVSTDDNDDKTDKILELEGELERFNIKDKFHRCAYLTHLMGSAMLYPKLKGDDAFQEKEYELIIDSSKIGIGDIEYFTIIEPTWYVPIKFNTIDPFSDWFYRVEFYAVLGQTVHSSRMLKFVGLEAPNILRPTYLFGGIPLSQQNIPWIQRFEQACQVVPEIINRLNLSVLKTDMYTMINQPAIGNPQGNTNSLQSRMSLFNITRNNTSTLAIDKDEEFEQVDLSLAHIKELIDQMGDNMCIVSSLDATQFLGRPLQGMNARGQHETNNKNENSTSLQEKIFRQNVTTVLRMLQLNLWGEIDEDITFRFNELGEMNELEAAQARFINAQTDELYLTAGVITPFQTAEKLAHDPDSGYDNLEISEEEFANQYAEQMKFTNKLGQSDADDPGELDEMGV